MGQVEFDELARGVPQGPGRPEAEFGGEGSQRARARERQQDRAPLSREEGDEVAEEQREFR